MIFVVGDSHVSVFSGENKIVESFPSCTFNLPFAVYRLGAPIAFNLKKYKTLYKAREKIESLISSLDFVFNKIILVFGEIDLRFHIVNQSRKKYKSPEHFVILCVDNYINGILDIFKEVPKDKIAIYGPIPNTMLSEDFSNKDCPICGDVKQRNLLTCIFNDYLKSRCEIEGFYFFTLFYDLIKLRNIQNYYLDDIHLNNKCYPLIMTKLEGFI